MKALCRTDRALWHGSKAFLLSYRGQLPRGLTQRRVKFSLEKTGAWPRLLRISNDQGLKQPWQFKSLLTSNMSCSSAGNSWNIHPDPPCIFVCISPSAKVSKAERNFFQLKYDEICRKFMMWCSVAIEEAARNRRKCHPLLQGLPGSSIPSACLKDHQLAAW